MLGNIIGDVVGSRFEFNNILSKEFDLFTDECEFTDDSVMTCAVASALINNTDFVQTLQDFGRKYPDVGYGMNFYDWIFSKTPTPYNSCGNGAAMRIAPVGFFAKTIDQVKEISAQVTNISHNHPAALKGAESVAMSIFMAKHKYTKKEIFNEIKQYYNFKKRVEDYREESHGHGEEICQVSVPQAFMCFFQGKNFEDVIRNAISIGGDSDTVAAIAGGIAEAYYGIPIPLIKQVKKYLPQDLWKIIIDFYKKI